MPTGGGGVDDESLASEYPRTTAGRPILSDRLVNQLETREREREREEQLQKMNPLTEAWKAR